MMLRFVCGFGLLRFVMDGWSEELFDVNWFGLWLNFSPIFHVGNRELPSRRDVLASWTRTPSPYIQFIHQSFSLPSHILIRLQAFWFAPCMHFISFLLLPNSFGKHFYSPPAIEIDFNDNRSMFFGRATELNPHQKRRYFHYFSFISLCFLICIRKILSGKLFTCSPGATLAKWNIFGNHHKDKKKRRQKGGGEMTKQQLSQSLTMESDVIDLQIISVQSLTLFMNASYKKTNWIASNKFCIHAG